MNAFVTRVAIAGSLLALAAVSGIVVSRLGRPLSSAGLAVHKLVAAATVVMTVLVVIAIQKSSGIAGTALLMTVLAGVFLLSLFVTGALLSLDRTVSALLLAVHRAASVMAPASAAILFWIRLRGRV